MTKDKFIKSYMWIGIIFMFGYIATIGNFLQSFPSNQTLYPYGYNGTTEVTLFKAVFTNYLGDIEITNYPLIVALVFFGMTLLVVIYTFVKEPLKDKAFSEMMIYNGMMSLMLVVSAGIFMYLIPDIVNGVITHTFLWTEMPRLTNDVVKVFNFGYLISIVFILLNFGLLYSKRERKFVQQEEEYDDENLLL